MPNPMSKFKDPESILTKIRDKCILDESTGCLEWTKAKDGHGYGRIYTEHGTMYTHRATFIAVFGPIKDPSKRLWHLCGNRACCNPLHLKLIP